MKSYMHRCVQRVNLNGDGVKFRWELEDAMALQSFTDKLFLMLIIG